jgi:hypothetical protein
LATLEEAQESAPSAWARWGLSWSTLRVGLATASVALLAYVIIVPDATLLLHQADRNAEYSRAPETSVDSLAIAAEAAKAPDEDALEGLAEDKTVRDLSKPAAEPARGRRTEGTAPAPGLLAVPPPTALQESAPTKEEPTTSALTEFGSFDGPMATADGIGTSGSLGSRGVGLGGGGNANFGSAPPSSDVARVDEAELAELAKAPSTIDFEGLELDEQSAPIAYDDVGSVASEYDEGEAKKSSRQRRSSRPAGRAQVEPMPAIASVTYRVYTRDVNAVLRLRDKVEAAGAQLRSTSGRSFSPQVFSSEDNYAKVQVHLPTGGVQAILDHLQSLGAATHVSGAYGDADEVQLHIEIIYQP